jgi:hypothetical protein
MFQGQSCILKRLRPSEDRVAIAHWGHRLEHLVQVARTMGQLSAWDQLRASGRQGSANADDLMAFAETPHWAAEVKQAAHDLADITAQQWHAFLKCPPALS